MRYLRILYIILFGLSGAFSCGDSVVDNIVNDSPPYVPVNHAPEIESIESDLGTLDIIPHMKITLTITASDPDGDALSYIFNSGQGSFNNLTDMGGGCMIDFYAGSVILPEEDVIVTIIASDPEGASASTQYNVGIGLRAPEFDSAAVDPASVVVIGGSSFLRAGQAAEIEFLTNSAGRWQVQAVSGTGVTSTTWDEGTPSYPYAGSSVVTIPIHGVDYAGTEPKLAAEGANTVFVIIKGDTGEASRSFVLWNDGTAPVISLSGYSPDPLSPADGLTENAVNGLYVEVDGISIQADDTVDMSEGRIIYTTDGSDPQFGSGSASAINIPSNATPVLSYTGDANLDTPALETGTFTVKYRARDRVGNESAINYITYTVDPDGPVITYNTAPSDPEYVHYTPPSPFIMNFSTDKNADYRIYAVTSVDFLPGNQYGDYGAAAYLLKDTTPLSGGSSDAFTVDNAALDLLLSGQNEYRVIIEATGSNGIASLNEVLTISWDDTDPVAGITVDPFDGILVVSGLEFCVDKEYTVNITDTISGVDRAEMILEETSSGADILSGSLTSAGGDDYTFSFNPCSDITTAYEDESLTVTVTSYDNAGNSVDVTDTFLFDNTPPDAISFITSEISPTNSASFDAILTFDEEVEVANLALADFNVTNCAITNVVAVSEIAGYDDTFTVTISPTADGDVSASINASAVNDNAGNLNTVSASAVVLIYDGTQPEAESLTTLVTSPTNVSPFEATLTFSEDVNAAELDSGDFGLTNCSITIDPTTGYADVFTLQVTPDGDGNVQVSLGAGATFDEAGNGNTALSTPLSLDYDSTRPDVTIEKASGQEDPTNNPSISFIVTFNDTVTGFTSGDIGQDGDATVTGWDVSTTDNIEFTITTTEITTDGTVEPSIPADSCVDDAGNSNTASTFLGSPVVYDTTPPIPSAATISSVTPTIGDGDPTNVNIIELSVVDNTGGDVAAYKYKLDGAASWVEPEKDISENFTITLADDNTDDGAHYVSVIVCDALGNYQDDADAVRFNWVLDTKDPVATISSPTGTASGQVYDSGVDFFVRGTVRVDFTANDTGGTGIKSIDYDVSGGTVSDSYDLADMTEPDSVFQYSTYAGGGNGRSLNSSGYDGGITITLTSYDDAGNSGSDTLTIIADNTAPDITIVDPVPYSTTLYLGRTVRIKADVYDTTGVVETSGTDTVNFSLDGSSYVAGTLQTECNDRIDNDGDGDRDTSDSNCSSTSDDDESAAGLSECSDSSDNDGDGDIDMDDTGCQTVNDNYEAGNIYYRDIYVSSYPEGQEGYVYIIATDKVGNESSVYDYNRQICEIWAKSDHSGGEILAVLKSNDTDRNLLIAGYDSDGNAVVEKRYRDGGGKIWAFGDENTEFPGAIYSIVEAQECFGSDCSFYVVAGMREDSSVERPWAAKLDYDTGEVLSEYFLTTGDTGVMNGKFTSICDEKDSSNYSVNYVAAGPVDDSGWKVKIARLLKNDFSETANEKSSFATSSSNANYSILHYRSGLGADCFYAGGENNGQPWIWSFNNDETFSDIENFTLSDTTEDGMVTFLVKGSSNTILLTGQQEDASLVLTGFLSKFTMDQFTGDLTADSSNPYLYNDISSIDSCVYKAYSTFKKRYVLAGINKADSEPWVASIDVSTLGTPVWERVYNGYYINTIFGSINSICTTDDDGYNGLFVGTDSGYYYKMTPDGDYND